MESLRNGQAKEISTFQFTSHPCLTGHCGWQSNILAPQLKLPVNISEATSKLFNDPSNFSSEHTTILNNATKPYYSRE
jgi:hypothetical protein